MNKPTLLLLPGLLTDARLWQHQINALADSAHCVVGDLTGANSIAGLANEVLRQVPTERFAVAGLSMGGYVALELMRQTPERVTGLALLDTSPYADTPEATANRRKLMHQANSDFDGVIETLLPKLIHFSHVHDRRVMDTIETMAKALGADVFLRQQEAIIARKDRSSELKNISCPTLVLCGNEDAITPVAVHRDMHNAIKHSRLEIIPTCGHLSALEQPAHVSEALTHWLSQCRESATNAQPNSIHQRY